MKIAFVITRSDTIGGAHVHVKDLAEALSEAGHQVKVFVGQNGPFTDILCSAGVPFHSLRYLSREISPVNDIKALLELKSALSGYQPDLVACHSSKAGWLGRIAARMAGLPAVFTAHGWAFTEGVPPVRRVIYRWAEFFAAPLARKVITVSRADRQLAIKYGIAKPCDLVTIWNGIPDVTMKRIVEQPTQVHRLVMVARLDAQKNHADLLRALAGLKQFDWHLDLVGDGPLEQDLRDMAVSLGIETRIDFLGLQNNVPYLLSASQVFVLISNWEGLPLSILEAMQAGLPVVATDVGGIREALSDQETGFIVPPGDIAMLRDRLNRLLGDNELRRQMGLAGRLRYEKHFTLDRMVMETLAVYQEVLGESG